MVDIAGESQVFDLTLLDPDAAPFTPTALTIRVVSPVVTSTDLALDNVIGSDGDLVSTSFDLTFIKTGDYVQISGFTTEGNNGLWLATGDGVNTATLSSVAIQKQSLGNPADELAGDNISICTETEFDGLTSDYVTNTGVGEYRAALPTSRLPGSWTFIFINRRTITGVATDDQIETHTRKLQASPTKII